jgi:hypothetical protein
MDLRWINSLLAQVPRWSRSMGEVVTFKGGVGTGPSCSGGRRDKQEHLAAGRFGQRTAQCEK